MIEATAFGSTGHVSRRVIFGAAALAAMRQERADAVIETVREFGVDHFDVAASYGEAELRLAPFLRDHRGEVFLATKTGDRGRDAALRSIHRSLERMGVDRLDLIQLHNLTDEAGWQQAMAPGGALEALVEAREEGLVGFLGVTGHGTQAARMHLRSLERFPFDSVLLPYNRTMMQSPRYASEFEELIETCEERGVAVQTIKALARRRWREGDASPRYSWYEPIRDPGALRRAVHFVLRRPGLFLNTSSDATLLRATLECARDFAAGAREEPPDDDVSRLAMEPLFVEGVSDTI